MPVKTFGWQVFKNQFLLMFFFLLKLEGCSDSTYRCERDFVQELNRPEVIDHSDTFLNSRLSSWVLLPESLGNKDEGFCDFWHSQVVPNY